MSATMEIDRRSLSHMSPDLRPVHSRLQIWAQWAKEPLPGSFPARTWLGRVIDEGTDGARVHHQPGEMPEPIAKTDRAVSQLGHEDRKVIRAYYLYWQPRELLARHCRMSLRKFDAVLNRARWRLWGAFERMD